ncbi:transposase [Rhodotorula toruloides]|uniref:Transposase n=1 Tax=Rhodotorula toruloides TaxID=5286 RepID=A0A511KDI3_RHOTO|nr:transposase [Rhodotorula toruloides]
MVSDQDKLFTSRFWRVLHSRLGLKLQMSTAFHPETDGRSERTNKTVIQVLRQYVSRQQKDWVRFLPTSEYTINAAENASTGKTPFELVLGFTPSLSPRLSIPSNVLAVNSLLDKRNMKIKEHGKRLPSRRRMRYKSKHGHGRAAKLFPRRDGPFEVVEVCPDTSTYRLQLTHDDKSRPVFHITKLKRYNLNDVDSFPSREPPRPGPIDVDGEEEFEVEAIVDKKGKGRGLRYLVKWRGYPDMDNGWEPLANVKGTEALKRWRERKR